MIRIDSSWPADIQAMAACKWQLSALPVLMYKNVHSAPVLESHHFRLALT
jgi:hypothetical protein